MKQCPFCEAELSDSATKCRHCGEWVDGRPQQGQTSAGPQTQQRPAPQSPYAQPQPGQAVNVHVHREDSILFAVITLVLYIFIFPVGFLLNIIGLFTGPKRGCFVAMFLVAVVLPIMLAAIGIGIAILMGAPLGEMLEEVMRELDRATR